MTATGRVDVRTPGGSYPVLIGLGALAELPGRLRDAGVARVALVTDETVAGFWLAPVAQALTGGGVHVDSVTVPPGEASKSFAEYRRLLTFFEDAGLDRQGAVVGLGGGVVGDLAGFAAATWLRGVRLFQVPTTLLAMVDAAIGGKTGIDTARTKNGVGAFHQPMLVLADLATLGSLPESEYLFAFAEVVKYAISLDAQLATTLVAERDRLLVRDPTRLADVVERCVAAKARVVAEDERESGVRAILNYGHTAGHAIEVALAYTVPHGRAVATGMQVAARIGARVGSCSDGLVAQQDELLGAFHLPGRLPRVKAEDVLAAIPRDKKAQGGEARWVLPRQIGKAVVGQRVPAEVVQAVVREVLG